MKVPEAKIQCPVEITLDLIYPLVTALLGLSAMLIGKANLTLCLSVMSLVFTNALLRIRGWIVTRGHYPGVISAALLYIPLAIYAYWVFLASSELTRIEGVPSVLLGVMCMVAVMRYVLLSQRDR